MFRNTSDLCLTSLPHWPPPQFWGALSRDSWSDHPATSWNQTGSRSWGQGRTCEARRSCRTASCDRRCLCSTLCLRNKKGPDFRGWLKWFLLFKTIARYLSSRLWIQRELTMKIKQNHRTLIVMLAPLTPGLPPHELQAAGGCKVLFDGVVDPLDEHAGQVGPLEHIGHGGAVTKRVDRPGTARGYACDREVLNSH